MKIDVSNLRHEPGAVIPISWETDASGFESVIPQTRFEGRLLLTGQLQHVEHGTFRLDAHLTVPYHALCDRCLTELAGELEFDIDEQFVSDWKPARPERSYGYEIEEEDTDDSDEAYFAYRGHTIDLTEAIGQLMIMALPYQMLCREDCRGLCATCGRDLNEGSCDCQDEADGDNNSPFADLQKLL